MQTGNRRGSATPPIDVVLTGWTPAPVPLVVMSVALAGYLAGVIRVRRRGGRWPLGRTIAFVVLGLGSYGVIELGFLGTYSADLRFAFTTRIALLLFAVPALVMLGAPVELARRASADPGHALIDRILARRPFRLLGNAVVAGAVSAALFFLFLTPLAGFVRTSPVLGASLGVLVPLGGMLLAIPLVESTAGRTGLFLTVEFLLLFVELVADAIPGILLRLSGTVLDGAAVVAAPLAWWPNPLRDQQLSGDLLWLIAEAADVPVLVLLFVRWARSDRREARDFDSLSDEEVEELTREHLRGRR